MIELGALDVALLLLFGGMVLMALFPPGWRL
jgi:hypothetical protein